MVGCTDNHKRYTHKLYNPENKMVIISKDIKWQEWKTTYPEETMKMFHDSNKEDLVIGIELVKNPMSYQEYHIP